MQSLSKNNKVRYGSLTGVHFLNLSSQDGGEVTDWRQLEVRGVNRGSEARQRVRRTDSEIRLPVTPVLRDATTAESDRMTVDKSRATG